MRFKSSPHKAGLWTTYKNSQTKENKLESDEGSSPQKVKVLTLIERRHINTMTTLYTEATPPN